MQASLSSKQHSNTHRVHGLYWTKIYAFHDWHFRSFECFSAACLMWCKSELTWYSGMNALLHLKMSTLTYRNLAVINLVTRPKGNNHSCGWLEYIWQGKCREIKSKTSKSLSSQGPLGALPIATHTKSTMRLVCSNNVHARTWKSLLTFCNAFVPKESSLGVEGAVDMFIFPFSFHADD